MEHDYFIKPELPPRVADTAVAMRVPAFVVFLASVWFLVTPESYYGMWQYPTAFFNFVIVGGILVVSSSLRLWYPLVTVGFSWLNVLLGIWVFITPWVFGFTSYTGAFINTLCLGVVITGMSFISARVRFLRGTPLNTAYADWEGLEHQTYDYIGTDRY